MYKKPGRIITVSAMAIILLVMLRTYPPYQPEPVDLTTSTSSKEERERDMLTPSPSVARYEFGVSVGKLFMQRIEPQ